VSRLAAGVAMLVWLLAMPVAASAHAVLLKASPSSSESLAQAPAQVQLLFSEPLDSKFSSVRVLDAQSQPVDTGDSHVDPDNEQLLVTSLRAGLASGVYTVSWRSLSAIDVHPDQGQYPLFVGVPVQQQSVQAAITAQGATGTPETTLGRWWFYVAASLFGGVLATWKLVLAPLLDEAPAVRPIVQGRAFRLMLVGGVLLVLGTLFSAVAQAGAAANVPLAQAFGQPLADLLLRGRFAAIWWPRVGLEIASLALVAFGGIDGLASECALATLPAVLLTSALTSHGAALPQGAVPGITIDWLHIVAATTWVGGLIALAASVRVLNRDSSAAFMLGRLVRRFARLALLAAVLVLLSGVLQSGLELGNLAALTGTLYGQLVLAKVALLLAMLALAGFNEWRARTSSGAGAFSFSRGVSAELTLGVVVFGVAAVLSSTPPATY
jgi:copper transport protein